MQKILKEAACSIFLTVPDEDLKTASVIIWSSLMFSELDDRAFIVFVSKVEKAED